MKNFILLLCFFPICLFAQKYDYHWISNYSAIPNNSLNFDFNITPTTISSETIPMPILFANISMSDFDGNLLFYSNGIQVMNAENELMENGDSLNWCDLTEDYYGQGIVSSSFMGIPAPGSDSLYYLICNVIDYDTTGIMLYAAKNILYSKIDVSANNGQGKVIAKDVLIGKANQFAEFSNACKHGNGRDWWYIVGEDTASIYYRTLLTPDGFSNLDIQEIGFQPPFSESRDGEGQNIFSPDGTKYVDFDPWNGVRIFDFDRCTGQLSNPVLITFPEKLIFGAGAAISPNSRFLYVDSDTAIFQFDLWASDIAASKDTVAIWDGFYSPGTISPTGFWVMQLMPDGKIYIITGSNPYYHYIANPDVKGDSCNVVQHELELPSLLATIPTFPNYRLYDLPGSPCDTLGIDGPPVAVKELELPEGEIVISPNPASGSLHINSVNCAWQPREVAIYDVLGREVLRRAHPASVRSFTLTLPFWANEIYFVQINLNNGRSVMHKILVQNH